MASSGGLHDSTADVINILAVQMQQGSTDAATPFQRQTSGPPAGQRPEVPTGTAAIRRGRSAQLDAQASSDTTMNTSTTNATVGPQMATAQAAKNTGSRAFSRSRSPTGAERVAASSASPSTTKKQGVPVWERLFRTGTKSSMAGTKPSEVSGVKNTGRQLSSSVESLTPSRSGGRRGRSKQTDIRASHPPVGGVTSHSSAAAADMMLMSADSATLASSLPRSGSAFSILDSAPSGRIPADVLTTTASDIAAPISSHSDPAQSTDPATLASPQSRTTDQHALPRVPSSVIAHIAADASHDDSPQFASLDKIQSPLLFSTPDDPLAAAEASMSEESAFEVMSTSRSSGVGVADDYNRNHAALQSTAATGVTIVSDEDGKRPGSGQEGLAVSKVPDPIRLPGTNDAAASSADATCEDVFDPARNSPSMLDGFESQREDLKFLIGKVKVQGLQELGEELLTMLSDRDANSFGKMLALSTGTITKRLAVSSMLDCLPDQHLDTAASAVIEQLPRKHRRHVLQYIMTPEVQRSKSLPELLGENDPLEDIRAASTSTMDDSSMLLVQRAHSLGESGAVSGLTRSVAWVGPGGEREGVSVMEGLMPSLSAEVSSAPGRLGSKSRGEEAATRDGFQAESLSPLHSAPAALVPTAPSTAYPPIMPDASSWNDTPTISAPIPDMPPFNSGITTDELDSAPRSTTITPALTATAGHPAVVVAVAPDSQNFMKVVPNEASDDAAAMATDSLFIEASEDIDHKLGESDHPMLGVVQHDDDEDDEEEDDDIDDEDYSATILAGGPTAPEPREKEDTPITTAAPAGHAVPQRLVRNESIVSSTTEFSATELDTTTTMLPIDAPISPTAGTSARPHSPRPTLMGPHTLTAHEDDLPSLSTAAAAMDIDANVQNELLPSVVATGDRGVVVDAMQVDERVKAPSSPIDAREPVQASLYSRLFGRRGTAAVSPRTSDDSGLPTTSGSPPHRQEADGVDMQPVTPPSPLPPIVTSPSSASESSGFNPLINAAGPSRMSPIDLDTPTSSGSLTSPGSQASAAAESPTSAASDIMLVDSQTGLPLIRRRSSDSLGSHMDRGDVPATFAMDTSSVFWSDNALFRSGETLQSTSSFRFASVSRDAVVAEGMEQFNVVSSNPLADGQHTASSREDNKFNGLLQELLDEPLSPPYNITDPAYPTVSGAVSRLSSGMSTVATDTLSMTPSLTPANSLSLSPSASQELGRGESFATASSMDARQSSFASLSSAADGRALRSVDTGSSLAALGFCKTDSDLTGADGMVAVIEAGEKVHEPVTKVGGVEGTHMLPSDDAEDMEEEGVGVIPTAGVKTRSADEAEYMEEEEEGVGIIPKAEVKPRGSDEFDDPITWDSPTAGYTPSLPSLSSYVSTGATSTPLTSPEMIAPADLPEHQVGTTPIHPPSNNPFISADPPLSQALTSAENPSQTASTPGLVTIGADIPTAAFTTSPSSTLPSDSIFLKPTSGDAVPFDSTIALVPSTDAAVLSDSISLQHRAATTADSDSSISTPSVGVNPFAQDPLFGDSLLSSTPVESSPAPIPSTDPTAESTGPMMISPASTPPRADSPTSYFDAASFGSNPSSPSVRSLSAVGSPLTTADVTPPVTTVAADTDASMAPATVAVAGGKDVSLRSVGDAAVAMGSIEKPGEQQVISSSQPSPATLTTLAPADNSPGENVETSSKGSDEKGIMGRAAGLLGMLWGRPKSATSSDSKDVPASPVAGSDAIAGSDVSVAPPSSRGESVPSSGDAIATGLPEHKPYDPANEGFFSEFMTQAKEGTSVSDFDVAHDTEGAVTTGNTISLEAAPEEEVEGIVAEDDFGADFKSEPLGDGRFTPSSSVLGTKADSSMTDSPRTQEMEASSQKGRDGVGSDEGGSPKDQGSPMASDGAVSDTVSERGFNNPAYNPGQAYSLSTPRKEDDDGARVGEGVVEGEAEVSPVMGLQTEVSSPGRKPPGSLPPSGRPSIPPGVIQASTASLLFDVHEHSSESDSADSSPPASPIAILPAQAATATPAAPPSSLPATEESTSLSFVPAPSLATAEPETPTGTFWRRSGLRASPRRSNSGSSLDGASPRVMPDSSAEAAPSSENAPKSRELSSGESTPVTLASPVTPPPSLATSAGPSEPTTPPGRKVLKAEEVERLRSHMRLLIDLASDSQLCAMYDAIQSSIGKTGFAWSDSPMTVVDASPLDYTPSNASWQANSDSTPQSPPPWISPSPAMSPDLSSPASRIPLAPAQRPVTLPPSPKPSSRPPSPSSVPHPTFFNPAPQASSSKDTIRDFHAPVQQPATPGHPAAHTAGSVAAAGSIAAAAGVAVGTAITAIASAIPSAPAMVSPSQPAPSASGPVGDVQLPATSTQVVPGMAPVSATAAAEADPMGDVELPGTSVQVVPGMPADGSQSTRELALLAHRAGLTSRAQELASRMPSDTQDASLADDETAPLLPGSSIKTAPAVPESPEALALTPASSPARSTSPSRQPFAQNTSTALTHPIPASATDAREVEFSLPTQADVITPAAPTLPTQAEIIPPASALPIQETETMPPTSTSPTQATETIIPAPTLLTQAEITAPAATIQAPSRVATKAGDKTKPSGPASPLQSSTLEVVESMLFAGSDTSPTQSTPVHSLTPDSAQRSLTPDSIITPASSIMPDTPDEEQTDRDTSPIATDSPGTVLPVAKSAVVVGNLSDRSHRSQRSAASSSAFEDEADGLFSAAESLSDGKAERGEKRPLAAQLAMADNPLYGAESSASDGVGYRAVAASGPMGAQAMDLKSRRLGSAESFYSAHDDSTPTTDGEAEHAFKSRELPPMPEEPTAPPPPSVPSEWAAPLVDTPILHEAAERLLVDAPKQMKLDGAHLALSQLSSATISSIIGIAMDRLTNEASGLVARESLSLITSFDAAWTILEFLPPGDRNNMARAWGAERTGQQKDVVTRKMLDRVPMDSMIAVAKKLAAKVPMDQVLAFSTQVLTQLDPSQLSQAVQGMLEAFPRRELCGWCQEARLQLPKNKLTEFDEWLVERVAAEQGLEGWVDAASGMAGTPNRDTAQSLSATSPDEQSIMSEVSPSPSSPPSMIPSPPLSSPETTPPRISSDTATSYRTAPPADSAISHAPADSATSRLPADSATSQLPSSDSTSSHAATPPPAQHASSRHAGVPTPVIVSGKVRSSSSSSPSAISSRNGPKSASSSSSTLKSSSQRNGLKAQLTQAAMMMGPDKDHERSVSPDTDVYRKKSASQEENIHRKKSASSEEDVHRKKSSSLEENDRHKRSASPDTDVHDNKSITPEDDVRLTTPFQHQVNIDSPRATSPNFHHLESLEAISETVSAAPTPPDSPLRVPRMPGMSSVDTADPEVPAVATRAFADRTQSGGSLTSSRGSGSMSFGRTTSEDGRKKKSGGLFACVAPAADGDMEGVTFMPDMPALAPLRSHSAHMEDDQAATPSFRTAPLAKSLTVQVPPAHSHSSTSPKLSPTKSAPQLSPTRPAPQPSPTASSSRSASSKAAKSASLTVQPPSSSTSNNFPGPQPSASSPKPAPSKGKNTPKLAPSLSMPTTTRHMHASDPELLNTGEYSPGSLPGTNANFFATSISGASFTSMPPVYMSADAETGGEREGQTKKKKWWRKIIPDYREYAKGGPIDRELKKQTGAAGRRYILVGNGLVVVDDIETANSRESLTSTRSSDPTPSRENSTNGRSRGWRRTPRAGSSSAQRSSHSASASRSTSVI